MTAHDKICLARTYRIPVWLISGVSDIVTSSEVHVDNLAALDRDVLCRIVTIQSRLAADLDVRFPFDDKLQYHIGDLRCPKCYEPVFPKGTNCDGCLEHGWDVDHLIHVTRSDVKRLGIRVCIQVRGILCGRSGLCARSNVGARPLVCPFCQTSMAKIGLEADPLTEVILDPKRFKTEQLVKEVFHNWLDDWEE